MHPFLKKLAKGSEKKICSIEIEFRGENSVQINASLFERKRKGIQLDATFKLEDIQHLKTKIKKETALVLNLTGRGIITKRIEKTEDFHFSFKQVIPNANEEDFFYQVYDAPDHLLVTIIRRNALDNLLSEISGTGFRIAKLYLGTLTAGTLGIILQKQTVFTPLSRIEINEAGIIEQVVPEVNQKCEETIDQEKISGDGLIAAASGYSYYSELPVSDVDSIYLHSDREELSYRILLNKIGFGSLAILLICLLFNQYVFSHYQERFVLLDQILQQTANERYELINLKTEISEKQMLVESTGMFQTRILSFYADRIASTVPQDIHLTNMWINPLPAKKLAEGEQAVFLPGDIHIEGKVPATTILNTWIAVLKTFEWAKEVKIDNYKLSAGDDLASFTVLMKVG